MKVRQYLNDVADFFYPRICPGCSGLLQRNEEIICLHCKFNLPRTRFYSQKPNPSEELFLGRIALFQADSWLYFRKKGISQKLMHELKYKGRKDIGIALGRWYGSEWKERNTLQLPLMLTSVPLHPQKLKKRGFNQSSEIASGFAETAGIPYSADILKRAVHSESQTKKNRYQRWENSVLSFEACGNGGLPEHIALLDDVITTGATIEACAAELYRKGVSRISVFSLCIAIN